MLNNYLNNYLGNGRHQNIRSVRCISSRIFPIFRHTDPLTIDDNNESRGAPYRLYSEKGAKGNPNACVLGKARTRVLTGGCFALCRRGIIVRDIYSGGKYNNISGRRSIRRSPGRGTGLPLCFSSAARVVSGQGGPRGGLGVHRRIPSRFSQLTYRFLAGCLA